MKIKCVCSNCKKQFDYEFELPRYCGDNCRAKYWRKVKKSKPKEVDEIVLPEEPIEPSSDEMLQATPPSPTVTSRVTPTVTSRVTNKNNNKCFCKKCQIGEPNKCLYKNF